MWAVQGIEKHCANAWTSDSFGRSFDWSSSAGKNSSNGIANGFWKHSFESCVEKYSFGSCLALRDSESCFGSYFGSYFGRHSFGTHSVGIGFATTASIHFAVTNSAWNDSSTLSFGNHSFGSRSTHSASTSSSSGSYSSLKHSLKHSSKHFSKYCSNRCRSRSCRSRNCRSQSHWSHRRRRSLCAYLACPAQCSSGC